MSQPILDQKTASPQRQLELLEALLRLPAGDMKATLDHVGNLVAGATGADKIDAFLYDAARDSLVAVGTSTQPLSRCNASSASTCCKFPTAGAWSTSSRPGRRT